LSEAEINNGRWKEIVHPGDRAAVDAVWTEACRAGTTAMLQYRVLRADGIRWVKTVASPTRDSTGAVVSYVGAVDDMTDSHLTTEALRQSESKYRTVVTTLKEVVFQIDRDGRWTYLNPAWTEIVGYRVEENVGTPFLQYVHPDDRAGSQQFFLSLIQNQRESCRNELRALTKDGSFRWVEVFAQVRLDEGNRVVGVTGTLNDITTRKEAETRIEASLREKEVLLKEVNHRVKNNLQVISSLLNLQRDQICDEKARELFTDAQSRIESMALVHEKLYQSSDLGRIDFADYLRDLTDNLGGLMGHRARNLSLKLESTGLQLGVDTAIPCGLIINELVTNAYKHAFPAGGQGHVVVAISRVNNGRLRLMVADDGCGLPVDMDLRQTRSLGLRLVHTLVQQLRGTLVVERERGTRFVLHLEEVRRRERPVA